MHGDAVTENPETNKKGLFLFGAVQLLLTLVTTTGTLHFSGLHLQFNKEKKSLKDHVKPYLLEGNSLFSSKAIFIVLSSVLRKKTKHFLLQKRCKKSIWLPSKN